MGHLEFGVIIIVYYNYIVAEVKASATYRFVIESLQIPDEPKNLANFLLALTIAFALGTDIISQHGTQNEILLRCKQT